MGSSQQNWWIIVLVVVGLYLIINSKGFMGAGIGMANPASVFCIEEGYKSEIKLSSTGIQSGFCTDPYAHIECDEWTYYNKCNPQIFAYETTPQTSPSGSISQICNLPCQSKICATVCIQSYIISNGACIDNDCGSGCGPDNINSFSTLDSCECKLKGGDWITPLCIRAPCPSFCSKPTDTVCCKYYDENLNKDIYSKQISSCAQLGVSIQVDNQFCEIQPPIPVQCQDGEKSYGTCGKGFKPDYFMNAICEDGKWQPIFYPLAIGYGPCECYNNDPCINGYGCRGFICEPSSVPECKTNTDCIITEECLNEKCVPKISEICSPLGYRKSGMFCDVDGKYKQQQMLNSPCENSFECSSNECSDGKCVSTTSMLQKILDWLRSIFGG